MDRLYLFIFLVVMLPAFVFWAGNGMGDPRESWADFVHQVRLLRGPPAPEPAPAEPEPPPPEPEPAATEPAPDAPAEKPVDWRAEGDRFFSQGWFEEAADFYQKVDAARAAEARFAAVLKRAFPKQDFEGPYLRVTTTEGGRYEGFARPEGDDLRLTRPTGLSLAIPEERIQKREPLPASEALQEAREFLAQNGPKTRERILAQVQAAFALGEAALAGRLIRRALELDRREAFLVDALSYRVPPAHRRDAMRAYQAIPGTAAEPPAAPQVRTPRRWSSGRKPRAPDAPLVRDPEAKKLMERAAKQRRRGWDLYDKVLKAGLEEARVQDVDEAIRRIESAITLYTQAQEIEPDNHALTVLIMEAAKRSRNLRYWREQLDAR